MDTQPMKFFARGKILDLNAPWPLLATLEIQVCTVPEPGR